MTKIKKDPTTAHTITVKLLRTVAKINKTVYSRILGEQSQIVKDSEDFLKYTTKKGTIKKKYLPNIARLGTAPATKIWGWGRK